MSFAGMFAFSPRFRSVMLRSAMASDTAFFICVLKRRINLCRLTALLFLPFGRLSMNCDTTTPSRKGYEDLRVRKCHSHSRRTCLGVFFFVFLWLLFFLCFFLFLVVVLVLFVFFGCFFLLVVFFFFLF